MNIHKQAQRLIETHEDKLQPVKKSLTEEGGEPERQARLIVVREKKLSYIVDYLTDRQDCPEEYVEGLDRVRKLNDEFIDEYPGDYTELLVTELMDSVERYPTTVCYAFELEPMDIETDHDFTERDSIEMLLEWLPDEEIPDDVVPRIEALDAVLRCKCEMHSNTYEELIDTIEREYYPSKYWWRHPDQVLSEE